MKNNVDFAKTYEMKWNEMKWVWLFWFLYSGSYFLSEMREFANNKTNGKRKEKEEKSYLVIRIIQQHQKQKPC